MKNVQEQRGKHKIKICERAFSKQRKSKQERKRTKGENFERMEQKSFSFFILYFVGGKRKKETLHKIQFGCSVRAVSPYGLVRF